MTGVAASIDRPNLHALIEEARRRARRRRQKYAAFVAFVAAASLGAYFAFGSGGGSGSAGAHQQQPVHAGVVHVSTRPMRNGALTVIGGEGISAIGRHGDLRTIYRCSSDSEEWPCYELQSAAWSPDGKRLAFGVTSVGAASAYNGLHIIDVMKGHDPSGGGDRLLSDAPGDGWYDIAWSPPGFDGYKIAYVSGQTIYIVRPDSQDAFELRTGTAAHSPFCGSCAGLPGDSSPTWAPDGTRIAYSARVGSVTSVYTIGIDGSGRRLVAKHGSAPAWSPDGNTIAYRTGCGIRLVTPLGRDLTPRASGRCHAIGLLGDPVWSPDGTRIAFAHLSRDAAFAQSGTYVMNANGSGLARVSSLTSHGAFHTGRPAWRPAPVRDRTKRS